MVCPKGWFHALLLVLLEDFKYNLYKFLTRTKWEKEIGTKKVKVQQFYVNF